LREKMIENNFSNIVVSPPAKCSNSAMKKKLLEEKYKHMLD
jgi:hypothetical protein